MHKIFHKQVFKNGFQQIEVEAPALVPYLLPGQFVYVMARPESGRVPFSSFDIDIRRGALTLFFDTADALTRSFHDLKVGDELYAVSGPYGQSLPALEKKTVLCFGQGLGAAGVLLVCRHYHATRNKVISAFPLKTKSDLVHDSKLRVCCHKVVMTTQDGSYDRRAGVPELLDKVTSEKFDWIFADGSIALYEEVIKLSRALDKPVLVNMLPHAREMMSPFETAVLDLGTGSRYPVLDGVWVGAADFAGAVLAQQVQQHKEYLAWRRSKSLSFPSPREFGIFPKWFSDLRKNRL